MTKKQITRLSFLDFENDKYALTTKIKEIDDNPTTIKLLNKEPDKYDISRIFCLDKELVTIKSIQEFFPNTEISDKTEIDDFLVFIIVD